MSKRRTIKKPKYLGLMRGLLNREANAHAQFRTLQNLKNETPLIHAEAIEETLRLNPLYSHLGLAESFPKKPPTIAQYNVLQEREIEFEVKTAIWRINNEREKILSVLADLEKINQAFEDSAFSTVISLLSKFNDSYGESFVYFAKSSLAYHLIGRGANREALYKTLEVYGVFRRNIMALSVHDTLGDEYEYRALRSSTIAFFADGDYEIPSKPDGKYGFDIVRHIMYPYCWNRADFARTLNTLSYASLVDAAIFLFSHLFDQVLSESIGVSANTKNSLDSEICERWESVSARKMPRFFTGDEPRFFDSYAYRRGIAFRELSEFRKFRVSVDPYTRDPKDSHIIVTPRIESSAASFFGEHLSIGDLTERADKQPSTLSEFDAKNSNVISRTAALVRLLRSGEDKQALSEQQLLTLLDTTQNVSALCTADEIRHLSKLNHESDLFRYIICALVYDQTKRNIDKTRLANALQDVVLKHCDGDIRIFANLLYDCGTHIAHHFYGLCTDEFLGLLFRMYHTSIEVSEARATIQEWFGERFNEPHAFERAKSIRLNSRLQLRRGQFNDSRIFVDTLRFNQWVEENLYSPLAAGLSAIGNSSPVLDEQLSLENFAQRRTATGQLVSVLETAFAEFCKNANYGIDSYLGRRIRHGTLIGTMAGPIRAVLQTPEASIMNRNEHVRTAVLSWLGDYEFQIRKLATEELQIRSDQKTKGLILASVLDKDKFTNVGSALKRLIAVYNDQKAIPITSLFLVDICWQLLEVDLKRIRQRIQEHRIKWGRLSALKVTQTDLTDHQRQLTSNLILLLNQTADQQFALLASWFSKPVSTATSANLSELLEVTIAEAQEHRPGFEPQLTIVGSPDVEILGGSYHHLYDALSVIMENAAQHGRLDGKLEIRVAVNTVSHTQDKICLSIQSQLARGSKSDLVRQHVNRALTYDKKEAMVQEGNSGLRKLMQMQSELREIENVAITPDEEQFTISFEFNLFLSTKS